MISVTISAQWRHDRRDRADDRPPAILSDLSPAAVHIVRDYCTPMDVAALRQEFKPINAAVQEQLDWLYSTTCYRSDHQAAVIDVVRAATGPWKHGGRAGLAHFLPDVACGCEGQVRISPAAFSALTTQV